MFLLQFTINDVNKKFGLMSIDIGKIDENE